MRIQVCHLQPGRSAVQPARFVTSHLSLDGLRNVDGACVREEVSHPRLFEMDQRPGIAHDVLHCSAGSFCWRAHSMSSR
jgi:hypothetical protein